jgi:hypothetical protein
MTNHPPPSSADAPDPSGWRDIASAPKDGKTWVLLGDFKEAEPEEHSVGTATFRDGVWTDGFVPRWYWSGGFAPTHWQPIPDPPLSIHKGAE